MKICSSCQNEKPLNQFSKKRQGLQSQCKDCHRIYRRQHYLDNRQKYIDKAKRINSTYRKTVQQFIIDYLLQHCCVDCGEADIVVLEFDHLADKSFNISSAIVKGKTIERIKEEIDKCEVRCANCHRRKTSKANNSYRTQADLV